MRLNAALQGDLRKYLRDELRQGERAVTTAVRRASDGLKAELRQQVTGAGMSRRMANTWRSRIYPEGEQSLGAVGFVWSKAPDLVRLYDQGAILRSKDGFYLAIPTPAAGRFGDGREKITPGAWERINGKRLRFVYRRGAPSLLVADDARLTSRGRARARSARSRSGGATVPIFILVPQVTVRRRFNVDAAAQKWVAMVPQLIVSNWPETGGHVGP